IQISTPTALAMTRAGCRIGRCARVRGRCDGGIRAHGRPPLFLPCQGLFSIPECSSWHQLKRKINRDCFLADWKKFKELLPGASYYPRPTIRWSDIERFLVLR